MPHPRLDPGAVADPAQLADAIDQLLTADPEWQAHSVRVRTAQDQLRALCSTEAWHSYLDVEARTNERLAHALEAVGRWAFAAGQGAP